MINQSSVIAAVHRFRRWVFVAGLYISLVQTSSGQYARNFQPEIPHDWEVDVQPPTDEMVARMLSNRTFVEPRALPAYPIRAFYLIPSNRTPMPGGVERMQEFLVILRDFYSEQMDRNGFPGKTLRFETEADGVTPKIHIVNAPNTDSYYRTDPWGRVVTAAQGAGLPIWSVGQVWLGVFEGHSMNPDGSVVGEWNGGASFGSGHDGGLGLTNSNSLAFANVDLVDENYNYGGVVLPELGPYPMVYTITAPAFDGSHLGNLASVRFGVLTHELSHGLGLPHDFRNDANFNGNLLGHGFRGFRSILRLGQYPNEETRLSYGNALTLSVSRYMNGDMSYSDNTKPSLTAHSSSSASIVNGQMEIPFAASDSSGLAVATLMLDSNIVGEMPLSGTSVSTQFLTSYYNKTGSNNFRIWVFDTQGNKQSVDITMTAEPGKNHAPVPVFSLSKSTVKVNETLAISVSGSEDPDNSIFTSTVAYDYDGDGTFDTGELPYSSSWHSTTYTTPGTRLVRVRITDSHGASTISTPIALRVVEDNAAVADWVLY